jgi:hypothetical protein
MKRYKIVGQRNANNLTEINKEYVELITRCKRIQARPSIEKKLPSVYRRKVFPGYNEKTLYTSVEQDLRDEATSLYAASLEDVTNKVENYVSKHISDAVTERKAALAEVEVLFNQLEDETEALANAKFQQEYEAECALQNSIVQGDEAIVELAFDKIFTSYNVVQLPFTVDICIEYHQEQKSAIVTVKIPLNLGIPQQRENLSSAGRVSVKDKLLREIDDDTSKTIIGTAFYLTSFIFNASPNIETVETALWNNRSTQGYLWMKFNRRRFASFRPHNANPLNAIFDWPYVCSMKMMRGGTRIEPMEAAVFNASISKEQNAYSQQWDSPLPEPSNEPEGSNFNVDTDNDGLSVDLNHLDPLFEEAAELVVGNNQVSVSMIQRKFSIGYNRSGRLMDQLEAAGIVSPYKDGKARTVLVNNDAELRRILDWLKS